MNFKFQIFLFILFLVGNNDYAQWNQDWVSTYDGTGNSYDIASYIAVDASGNIYVTGRSIGNGTSYDIVTVKYNTSGTQQWVSRYDGSGYDDEPSGLVIDVSGNPCVTGTTYNGSNSNYITIKYNSSGVQQWATSYNGTGNSEDIAKGIATDNNNNIYVTGGSVGTGNDDFDYVTIKYNSSGTQQWVVRYNGHGDGYDMAMAIGINNDITGHTHPGIYLTGTSYYDATEKNNWETFCYDFDGSLISGPIIYGAGGNEDDYPVALVVSPSGDCYVTGAKVDYENNQDTPYRWATMRNGWDENNDPPFFEMWCIRYYGNGPHDNIPYSIAIDNNGNAYVTGTISASSTNSDFATIKLNANSTDGGNPAWTTTYDGSGNAFDEARSIALDNSNPPNIFVTGYSRTTSYNGSEDYTTIMYNNSGNQQWVVTYDGTSNREDNANAIAYSNSSIYVTGAVNILWFSNGGDFGTTKYSPDDGDFKSTDLNNYLISQNYPNPFNPITKITYSIPKQSNVSIIVYDVLGQEAATLVNNELKQAGVYDVTFNASNLPSGVYYYRLTAGEYTEVRKMILVK